MALLPQADIPELNLDAPIPGQSLTAPLGDRPWQNPAQYGSAEEALEFYIPRIMESDFTDQLLDVIEMGIPLTTIANSLQLASVMEGKHSIDVGILIMPVLIELLELIATNAKIEYNKGTELKDTDKISEVKMSKIITRMKAKDDEDMEMPVEEPQEDEEMEEDMPTGLMARRK
tara:strand:+ start:12 stop:533 length:522 start_codon:yes stop_codon:yes gene_type:complete